MFFKITDSIIPGFAPGFHTFEFIKTKAFKFVSKYFNRLLEGIFYDSFTILIHFATNLFHPTVALNLHQAKISILTSSMIVSTSRLILQVPCDL